MCVQNPQLDYREPPRKFSESGMLDLEVYIANCVKMRFVCLTCQHWMALKIILFPLPPFSFALSFFLVSSAPVYIMLHGRSTCVLACSGYGRQGSQLRKLLVISRIRTKYSEPHRCRKRNRRRNFCSTSCHIPTLDA